jgi:hypothetical protein
MLAVGLPASSSADNLRAVDLTPGLEIKAANVARYADVVGPGLRRIVEDGVPLRVGTRTMIETPPPLAEATVRYAGRARLSDDSASVLDHVAGLPFPDVDGSDPRSAAKMILNYEAAVARDDLTLKLPVCDTGRLPDAGKPFVVDRHFLLDAFRRLYFTGRTTVGPHPELSPNRDSVRFKERWSWLMEPFDLKGASGLTFRYLDPARNDDSWLYLPQLRRVRRLSVAQRSDALFNQDIDTDSFLGFSGRPSRFDWRLLGEQTTLAVFESDGLPPVWRESPGFYLPKGDWQPREVWVLEAKAKDPQYAHPRMVFYLDKQSWHIAMSELYDAKGELLKVSVSSFLYAKRPTAGARYGFPYRMLFPASLSMLDVQKRHVTFCGMPGTPGEQGWYVNVGEVAGTTEGQFSTYY